MPKAGVMNCGHGARSQLAVGDVATRADKRPALLPGGGETEYGYLDFANPVIRDGLDTLRRGGCERILTVPGRLFAAMHSKTDSPSVFITDMAQQRMQASYGLFSGIMIDRSHGFTDQAAAQHAVMQCVKEGQLGDRPKALATSAERIIEQTCAVAPRKLRNRSIAQAGPRVRGRRDAENYPVRARGVWAHERCRSSGLRRSASAHMRDMQISQCGSGVSG